MDHNYHRGDQERYIRKLKRTVEDLEEKNLILVKKIRNASEKLTRRENKITNLKDMFKEMEDQNLLLKEHLVTINEKFSSTSKALFKELGELGSNNQKKKPYSEEIRQFALTLHFYSPKAYAFLRKHFCLPHENTIREWSARVDGEPGFTGQSFEFLRQEAEKKKYQILAALDIDEMSIRKHVAWSKDKFTGFVNYGKVSNNTEEEQTVASSVLVFMLVAVNGSWKIPLGYFFVHGTPGWLLTNLVKECFSRIHETGVKCIALVCDGLSSNLTMAKMLGANLDPDAIDPSFPNPGNQSDPDDKIFLILDVCHMIKLLRNLWSDFIRIKNGLTDEVKETNNTA